MMRDALHTAECAAVPRASRYDYVNALRTCLVHMMLFMGERGVYDNDLQLAVRLKPHQAHRCRAALVHRLLLGRNVRVHHCKSSAPPSPLWPSTAGQSVRRGSGSTLARPALRVCAQSAALYTASITSPAPLSATPAARSKPAARAPAGDQTGVASFNWTIGDADVERT